MKKKLVVMAAIVTLVISLGGCAKKVSSQEAADAFINTEVYLKHFDKYERAFGSQVNAESESLVKEEIAKDLAKIGIEKADSAQVVEALIEIMSEKTEITGTVLSEEKKQAVIELTVQGFDMKKFTTNVEKKSQEKLLALIKAAGIEGVASLDDLANLSKQGDYDRILEINEEFKSNSKNLTDVIIAAVNELEVVEKEQKVMLKLSENAKNKKYWQVDEEAKTLNALQLLIFN